MTDREMLELSAKAAGYSTAPYYESQSMLADKYEFCDGPRGWNPLDDDGDSRRLRIKLKIDLLFGTNHVIANTDKHRTAILRYFDQDGSAEAAARMAVLMVASEIGRGMV